MASAAEYSHDTSDAELGSAAARDRASRSSSNAGCRRRSRRPGSARPRTRRWCAPASRARAAGPGICAPTARRSIGRPGRARAARRLDPPVGRRSARRAGRARSRSARAAAGRLVGARPAVRRSARRRSGAPDLGAAAVRDRGAAAAALGPRRRLRQGGRQRGAPAHDAAPRRRRPSKGCARARSRPMQPLLDGRLKIEGDRALAMQLLLLAREPARPALTSAAPLVGRRSAARPRAAGEPRAGRLRGARGARGRQRRLSRAAELLARASSPRASSAASSSRSAGDRLAVLGRPPPRPRGRRRACRPAARARPASPARSASTFARPAHGLVGVLASAAPPARGPRSASSQRRLAARRASSASATW